MCDRRVEYANTLPLSSRVSTTIDANACAVLFTNFISPVAHCFWRKDRHSFRFCYRGVASSGNHTSMSQGEFRGYGCPTRIISQPEQANRIHFRDFLELFVEGGEGQRVSLRLTRREGRCFVCSPGRRESYVVSGAWQERGLLVSEVFFNLCSSSRDLGPSCSVEPHKLVKDGARKTPSVA